MDKTRYILEANNISKSYGMVNAVTGADLHLSDNIYGLLGRNGAGKTTLLNLLSSRIFADSGNVIINGKDAVKHPEVIGQNCCFMPEEHYFPARHKIGKLLSYARGVFPNYDKNSEERLCRSFQLDMDREYGQLSRGHQSVFKIVLGLATKSPITVFDEPVLGLDAVARDRFYSELIDDFSKTPRLFIISTHFIEESADLLNEAIIMDKGKIVRQAPVDELLSGVCYVSGKSSLVDRFISNRKVLSSRLINDLQTAVIEGNIATIQKIPGLNYSTLTFQKLFIHLTGGNDEQEQS